MAGAVSGRKSTIYDIAKATETSPATVSLVLNGSWARYRIKEETAQRILESAQILGYQVNLKARGLRLSRSGLAGMILPHYRNRFFADLAETFEAEARRRSLCPIVVSTQRDRDVEINVVQTLLAQQVEFLFITGVRDPQQLNHYCAEASVPCVNLDLPGKGAPSVTSDNKAGARQLTEALIAKIIASGGALEDFLCLGGIAGEYATENRAAGFIEALEQKGVTNAKEMLLLCGHSPAGNSAAMAAYYAKQGRLPAAMFINNVMAFEGFVQFAAALPRKAFKTLIVGCFDWDPFAAHLPYDIIMMRQDVETMISTAFEALSAKGQEGRLLQLIPPILMSAQAEIFRG